MENKSPHILQEKIKKIGEGYQIRQYVVGKKLGRGGFAQCYEVTDLETKRILAAKIIPKASLKKKSTQQKVVIRNFLMRLIKLLGKLHF